MPGSLSWRALVTARALFALALPGFLTISACNGHREERGATKKATGATVARSRVKPQLTRRAEPKAPLEQFVQQHVEEADASGMRVLVYVGATWCEPCKRFHKALESGQLDDALAGTKFIEFDWDRDGTELRAAGYAGQYIPLFSVPDQSGHASGRAIEGSVKGDGAVSEDLVPRLLALLDGRPTL
jgi:thiol:disulfide interchange protein